MHPYHPARNKKCSFPPSRSHCVPLIDRFRIYPDPMYRWAHGAGYFAQLRQHYGRSIVCCAKLENATEQSLAGRHTCSTRTWNVLTRMTALKLPQAAAKAAHTSAVRRLSDVALARTVSRGSIPNPTVTTAAAAAIPATTKNAKRHPCKISSRDTSGKDTSNLYCHLPYPACSGTV